ncbi:hypothetical protein AB0F17_17090 [Nonomuraea sp. NPDC026600]|uniref:hypothetical protein n=1 Tax=Nonomuraea sp. NPDC026600 TaxID=3155363 RepID=UPI0033CD6A5B
MDLCDIPEGRAGRPSKALTLAQALAVLTQAEKSGKRMRAYIIPSLPIGARTEKLRALLWLHVVAYDEAQAAWLPVGHVGWEHKDFAICVWRSVLQKGDTKTIKSRRLLKAPPALRERAAPAQGSPGHHAGEGGGAMEGHGPRVLHTHGYSRHRAQRTARLPEDRRGERAHRTGVVT